MNPNSTPTNKQAEAAFAAAQCSPSRPPVSGDAKLKLVDLWLSGETNEARLILEAFKIGREDALRAMGNAAGEPAPTETQREGKNL